MLNISCFPTTFSLSCRIRLNMLKVFKQSKHILDLLKISNFLLLHYRTCWFQEIELNKMDNVMTALSKEHFYGKVCRKCGHQFYSITQNSQCMKETLLKTRYFERELSKDFKNVNLIVSFAPSPFFRTSLWKTKGTCD